MDRINNILSVQNLFGVNNPIQTMQLQMQMLQQLQRQQQPQPQQAQTPTPSPTNQQIQPNIHQTNDQNYRHSSFSSTNSRNGRNNHQDLGEDLIDLITCKLCKGYLIDAATLDLCMHSFCRPCAVKFIREKPRCPECNIEIKDKRFLNRLKTDVTMQNIVYKLVPGLYEKEMARRRKFYAARPSPTPRYKSEMFGDIPPSKTIKPDDMLNVGITWLRECSESEPIKTYLLCRADSTMQVLKKLIIGKFGLEKPIKIYYGNSEIFYDLTTLMEVAASFCWSPEAKVLNLNFKEHELKDCESIKKTRESSTLINSSPLTSFGHGL